MSRTATILSKYGLLLGLAITCVIIGLANPVFLSFTNLSNILLQATINTIIAIGMTFVIISGGIDLSVGSIVAVAGMIVGLLMQAGLPIPAAIGGALLAGAICGGINGFIIARWRIPPFIATLGMISAARGGALMLTGRLLRFRISKLLCLLRHGIRSRCPSAGCRDGNPGGYGGFFRDLHLFGGLLVRDWRQCQSGLAVWRRSASVYGRRLCGKRRSCCD